MFPCKLLNISYIVYFNNNIFPLKLFNIFTDIFMSNNVLSYGNHFRKHRLIFCLMFATSLNQMLSCFLTFVISKN